MIKGASTFMHINPVMVDSIEKSTENVRSFKNTTSLPMSNGEVKVMIEANRTLQPSVVRSFEMDIDKTKNPEQLTLVKRKKRRRRRRKTKPSSVVQNTTLVQELSEVDCPSRDDHLSTILTTLSLFREINTKAAVNTSGIVNTINGENATAGFFHTSFPRMPFTRSKKKLLVLDINGLLADIVTPPPKEYKADTNIKRRAIFSRPSCRDFLNFCFERFEVGVWSSRSDKIASKVIDYLMGDMKHKLLFCWVSNFNFSLDFCLHMLFLQCLLFHICYNYLLILHVTIHAALFQDLSRCTATEFRTLENRHKTLVFKELRRIWEKHDPDLPWEKGEYNETNTLLLDDSPYKALLNPAYTAVFPHSYNFQNWSDNSLGAGGDIRVYLEKLSAAEDVQKFVEQNPFGQMPISESNESWGFYFKVMSAMYSLPRSI
ncbi:uncharacterized protein LOC115700817 isoform X1 [Cannabis sativa]|uniref:uncharacterized protein LOC115700817 isoform X1 n=1 Tax=Cannabis sativa TaxID=3483 RepID=UPI0029CAA452|nr:uncharacterized protein LOC115700817 isoform X1 [Cannabis sativa]XP_060958983.1 uncharacterized protein LOC115700817 isoform X1 [Cannabis sativa]